MKVIDIMGRRGLTVDELVLLDSLPPAVASTVLMWLAFVENEVAVYDAHLKHLRVVITLPWWRRVQRAALLRRVHAVLTLLAPKITFDIVIKWSFR